MRHHDDSQRSDRLAATQPVGPPWVPPRPLTFETEKQLTAPADRSVRDPAHAVAFTTAVAIGGTPPRIALARRCGRPSSGRCWPDGTHPDQTLFSVNCRNLQKMEVQMILKEPHARAA